MKQHFILTMMVLLTAQGIANCQSTSSIPSDYHKGSFYVFWGWNRGCFTNSDIQFKGDDYNFTLSNVIANDRQSPFDFALYFSPQRLTIPQYNVRFGYFITDKYSISIGTDHMKYVMKNNQTVKINGYINNSGTEYDGNYVDQDIVLKQNFLLFEHTDGLNYVNTELRRMDHLLQKKNFSLHLIEGVGIGALVPKTNTTLLAKPRHDAFHLSGYGTDLMVALNATFFKHFFVQSELKGGYINMPDIRTTQSKSDSANQHFFFAQANIVFGVNFNISKKLHSSE